MDKVNSFDVEDRITVLGPVKKTELRALYQNIDYVFLLSKLESFSNNIIESWFFKKVLVISDKEWSNAICKEGALYVDRDNPLGIVEKILAMKKIVQESQYYCKRRWDFKDISLNKRKGRFELNYIDSLYESN